MKKFLLALAAVALVVFMLRAPAWLDPIVNQDIYLEWMMGEETQYTGQITLWNVYDGEARLSSEWLQKCIAKFEKENKGVFIEFITLSSSEVFIRQNRGESADIYVYPEGASIRGAEVDVYFGIPQPKEEKKIESDFEFDVEQAQDGAQPTPSPAPALDGYNVWIASETFDIAERGRAFADFLAEQAGDMLE